MRSIPSTLARYGPPAREPLSATVLVTTYNWPQALERSLRALFAQSRRDFEIVIADDGSGPETAAMIERLGGESPVPLLHVWRPDEGFRVAEMRNRAIAATTAPYVIFLDQDCFIFKDFVAVNLALSEPGWFVSGKRSYIRPKLTERILDQELAAERWGCGGWFLRGLVNQATRPFHLLRYPLSGAWRYGKARVWDGVQTCNAGVWRADIERVNGFDERYQAHGLEDSDFFVRLFHAGITRKRGDYASIVLHLHHRRPKSESPNWAMFRETEASGRIEALVGLRQAGPG